MRRAREPRSPPLPNAPRSRSTLPALPDSSQSRVPRSVHVERARRLPNPATRFSHMICLRAPVAPLRGPDPGALAPGWRSPPQPGGRAAAEDAARPASSSLSLAVGANASAELRRGLSKGRVAVADLPGALADPLRRAARRSCRREPRSRTGRRRAAGASGRRSRRHRPRRSPPRSRSGERGLHTEYLPPFQPEAPDGGLDVDTPGEQDDQRLLLVGHAAAHLPPAGSQERGDPQPDRRCVHSTRPGARVEYLGAARRRRAERSVHQPPTPRRADEG